LLQLELEQQKVLKEVRANEIVAERLALERRSESEIEARIAAELQATEVIRKLSTAEMLAKEAANERMQACEQTISAMLAREDLDRQMTEAERDEFSRINAELETGHLIKKLRRTSFVSKVSQVALAASLVFSFSYMFSGENSVDVAATATPVVAEAAVVKTQTAQPVVLTSFKMATELGSLQFAPQQSKIIAKN